MIKKHAWWLLILIGFLTYAGLVEPYWIKVETHSLVIAGFRKEYVSIVHIADTHSTGMGRRERDLVGIVQDLEPDYVFITGDLLKSDSPIDKSLEFAKLVLQVGKVAVSPGIGFGDTGDTHVRFALVENTHRIKQAVKGIKKLF